MMHAAQSLTPSLWPYLIAAVPGLLVALATLWGVWLSKRREAQSAPAADKLITAQTAQTEADIVHKSVEASVRTGEFTLKALEMADATIDRLSARKELLESALERELAELRREVKGIDEKQADIFLILGELRKKEKQDEE